MTAIHEPSHASGSVRARQVTTSPSPLRELAKRITMPVLTRVSELERTFSPPPEQDGGPPGYRGVFSALYSNAEVGLSDLLTFFYKLEARFGGGEKIPRASSLRDSSCLWRLERFSHSRLAQGRA